MLSRSAPGSKGHRREHGIAFGAVRSVPSQLYVEEHGEGEPLLLIEGLGQSLWAWREQVPAFARNYQTIAFDTRGTGRSPVPAESYGIDELALDAAEILGGRHARHAIGAGLAVGQCNQGLDQPSVRLDQRRIKFIA